MSGSKELFGASSSVKEFGWINDPVGLAAFLAKNPIQDFSEAAPLLKGTGDGKVILLYEAVRKVWGRDHDPGPQQIGDCVSWGYAGCVDILACLEVLAGEAEEHSWDLRTCTEAVYALSRVEYGNMDGSYEDGSYGAWAAQAVSKGGTLSRKRLGEYSPQRAKDWGAKGLPDELEPEAREHIVSKVSKVTSWEDLKASIANGYPVAVCSSQGFEEVRDSKGRCRPRGTWNHCMKFLGVRDDGWSAALISNSHGSGSPTGPKGDYDIPDNCWWVDAAVVSSMLRVGDSFSLAGFKGYEKKVDKVIDWIF